MATDRVNIPATGTGDTGPVPVATKDDGSGLKHQQVVAEFMVSTTPTAVSSATPLPVVQTGTPALPTGAATETTLAAVNTKLGSSLPLPTGAATETTLAAVNTKLGSSLPLPTGAATQTTLASILAKQPALGTVGSPSSDFITVQGNASGTPVPVSGTFTSSGAADMTATGALTTSGQTASITGMNGMSVCQIQLTGSVAGFSIGLEAQIDGATWVGVPRGAVITDASDGITSSTTFGAIGNYIVPCAGYSGIRVRIIAGSGSLGVTLRASAGATLTTLASMLPAGTNTIGGVQLIDASGTNVGVVDSNGALSVKEKRAATPTLSNVAGSATSVTVLASNGARLGATIWNDSAAILYVKFGTTASTTSCTVKLVADAYYEVPFGYTGRIDGIWASATGNARITEIV